MTASTDWLSAVAILASGVVLGLMFVYFVRRKPVATPVEDLEVRDFEAKRDVLLQQLRGPEIVGEERTRLELDAAQVLRRIDERKKKVRKPSMERPVVDPLKRATMVGFAWGSTSMLILGVLVYFVMQSAKSREANQSLTGGETTSTIRPAQAPPDPAVQELETAVQKSPEDLKTRIALAKAYLERENLMGVMEQTQYVLSKSPDDSHALAYQAFVRAAMGQHSDAVSMLERATRSDPNFIDAWVFLAWAKMQEGKTKEAEAAIAEAAKRHPEEKQRLAMVFAQMKQPTSAQSAELPQGHPAVAAGDAPAIHVRLEVDPSAKSKTGTVFVIARAEGVSAGPPIAVKRLSASMLPVTIDLSAADSMMGQPLPPRVRIEARVDSDGDPLTKNPSDPTAVQDGVALGSSIKLKMQ